ncbi:MAG: NAD(P)-dependent oxidoreductase [Phycisphaerales bacterium]|nr:NAD(P)-dependent oxidoreductase [Phycisphaerales bacterium]
MTDATKIGFLHPGEMGVSLAASAIASGMEAYWCADGRSGATRKRAAEHGLTELGTISAMCDVCEMIVSICPPAAADDVADAVLSCGYSGVYIDANAISPMRARAIAGRVHAAGAHYVDGSVIGGPAWTPDETIMYLSGPHAERVPACFRDGMLATRVIGDQVDRASALKMCYAAFTKGSTAMLCAIIAAAHALGVDDELRNQWDEDAAGSTADRYARLCRVTRKAWRYEGEMREIAQTLEHAGLPSGFHSAAAELYAGMSSFKDRDPLPDPGEVIEALLT